ncbi:MAG: hypothetical protein RIS64_3214 [Bacteroidota bacterium]|jgi:hypothetical protein
MLKKIIIFITLVVNVFVSTAQNLPNKYYQMKHIDSIMYFTWDYKIGGLIEIEVTIDNKTTKSQCAGSIGFRESRLATKPKPQIKLFHLKDGKRLEMRLRLTAMPILSDGLCVLLTSDSMRAKRKKDVFQLTFDMKKSCNLPDSTLVRTRLYWSKDSWANPETDHLLTEQVLPFGKTVTLTGKYSMDKMDKNGFLFLQIVDEKGNSLLISEAIFAETIQ